MTWTFLQPGILRDKTMQDKLIYIPNDNKQNGPTLVEKFAHTSFQPTNKIT